MNLKFPRPYLVIVPLFFLLFAPGISAYPGVYASPNIENVAISTDGERLAVLANDGGSRIIKIINFSAPKNVSGYSVGNQKIRDMFFASEKILVVVTSVAGVPAGLICCKGEWSTAQFIDVETRERREVSLNIRGEITANVIDHEILDVRKIKGKKKIFVSGLSWGGDEYVATLFSISLADGDVKIVDRSRFRAASWLTDASGAVRVRSEYDRASKKWRAVIKTASAGEKTLSGESQGDSPSICGFLSDENTALLRVPGLDGEAASSKVSLLDGTVSSPDAGESEGLACMRDLGTGKIYATRSFERGYEFDDVAVKHAWNFLKAQHPDGALEMVSHTADFRTIVFSAADPKEGFFVALMDVPTKRVVKLGEIYKGMGQIAASKYVSFKARDGLRLPAVVTLPARENLHDLPMVVVLRDGLAGVATTDFNPFRESLVRQGYVVVEPNVRGAYVDSTLRRSGYGEFGGKSQDDIVDGVKFFVTAGLVDPKRVCVVGFGYGGYKAMSALAKMDFGFRCGAAVGGFFDVVSVFEYFRSEKKISYEGQWLERYLGTTAEKLALYDSFSLLGRAGSIRAPVLLIHSTDDTVFPLRQSKLMFKALKEKGADVQFVPLRGDDHWLSVDETRGQMLDSVASFLSRHNPP